MRKRWACALVFIAFALISSTSVFADLGHSDVYAVCRVTMRDGKTIEGIVRIAAGGYEKALHANGFYYELNGRPYTVDLFSPAFRSINMVSGETIYDPEVTDRGTGFPPDRGTLYYVRTVPTEHYFNNANEDSLKKALKTTSGVIVLDRTIIHHGLYVLSDYIPIYSSVVAYDNDEDLDLNSALPPEKRMRPSTSVNVPNKIPLEGIVRLELLAKPSKEWLTAIAEHKSKLNRKREASGAEDWMIPVWFHEIQPGSELYDEYKNFKSWAY